MCLGVYLCSDGKLDAMALNRASDTLALAPEPSPWPVLTESCVVADRAKGCGCVLNSLRDPDLLDAAERERAGRAARDLRRMVDAAAKSGRTALVLYRLGDEDKTPEEVSVGCASYFGENGAWLEGAVERPKLFWVGEPADRPDAEGVAEA